MSKWTPVADPNADQEAEKYDNPVPSRDYILALLNEDGQPLTHRQICQAFGIDDEELVEGVRRRLRAMERDGQLLRNRRGAYGVVAKMDLVSGTLIGHRDGYGFLKPDQGGSDYYLSPRQMRCGFDGDRVLARPSGEDHRGRREAVIVEVLERRTLQLVGRFFTEHGVAFVTPENQRMTQDILIPGDATQDARHGQFVVVDIIEPPTYRHQAQGRVREVLGDHMAPGMEIDVAIRNHQIPHEWPETVLAQAQALGDAVRPDDLAYRIDLRDLPLVTIDGEDARDFDDALYCEKTKTGGWKLLVAIADVSHYVHPGDVLDQEAARRGNSVYFPECVVPMLPESLSNGLCSLNPHVDRLAMVCDMRVSANGRLTRYSFHEAVIRSHARLTYTKVGAVLDDPDSLLARAVMSEHSAVLPMVYELHALYKALRSQREQRGAIDFETTETRIVFGDDRKIERIVPVVRNDAHKIVEECMLCANVATARCLDKHGLPALYRVHEGPKDEKLQKLRLFLMEMGIEFQRRQKPSPADFQQALQQIQGRPDADLIQTVMLRSMSQAVYSPENKGHFGLAYPAYAHFTSPIRRYPDLLIHRAIRYLIRSDIPSNHVQRLPDTPLLARTQWLPYDEAAMVMLGEQCSMTERRADEATWDVIGWLKCEYMVSRVGEDFAGVIVAVTQFGLFVALDEIYVEGLVHVSALTNDYYHFDDVRHRLAGEKSGMIFALGDPVRVRVARVNLDDRKIDFELVEGGKRQRWSKAGKGKKAEAAGKRAAKQSKGSSKASLQADNKTAKSPKGGKKATKVSKAKKKGKAGGAASGSARKSSRKRK